MFNNISIIGCGLIGSSILRAINKKKISKKVTIYDKSKDVLAFLKQENLDANVSDDILTAVKDAEMIIIATPLSAYKEILLSIKYVSKVIKSQYLITDSFIKANKCDYLFHGSDTQNNANLTNLKTIKRTKSISSTALRNFNKLTMKKIKEIF